MASSRNFLLIALNASLTVAFIFMSLTSFPNLKSVGLAVSSGESSSGSTSRGSLVEMKKMVLGSKPPGCVNKCLNCRPCKATLVIPSHDQKKKALRSAATHGDDANYYLLSWKCRCGDKLFQP
ncbi:hypothetical protein ACOSP7_020873 [Xanthoceras sorbifolium]|uniref:Epidermal patterning factor-like protein n=1 Tax=Xanthoceras sorbifolium TaxID=99658 RepID=A0ABQ8HL27_9ROSI|nr:hypothetical protein JRO89_XS09G0118800 [Xanthoceras sorbifolium]